MKNLVITGASGSLGSLMVQKLKKKYNIICIDINKSGLKKLKKNYKEVNIYHCNIANPLAVSRLVNKINKKFNKIDILINNAGFIYSGPIIKFTENKGFLAHDYKDWKKILNKNLDTMFVFSSKVIELMCNTRNPGLIINISSISAQGNVGQSAYSVAKASIEILTKIWAKELSKFKIRVCCISPGFFNTASTHNSLSKSKIQHVESNTPVGRLGKISELTDAINFIVKNKFFNGKVLKIDGGLEI
jgi:3-oxoacyl-[acyl-carrier protein] reductase